MYLRGIILHCQLHIKQSRSISSIFHLLKGKRGIQTVHDARIFQLEKLFGIYSSLDKETFEKEVESLTKQEYLVMDMEKENVYLLTNKAQHWLDQYQQDLRLNYFNGLKYNQTAGDFLKRLLLLIQTYTNLHMNRSSFIPVVDTPSVISWVKDYYKKMTSVPTENILYLLYADLNDVLERFPEKEAQFFLDHLSGYNRYGMASSQLSKKYQLNRINIPLLRTAIIHKMLSIIEKEKAHLKILPSINIKESENIFITNTSMLTYKFLQLGLSPEEIANKRNLKLNTIYDHIVEIALFDPFFTINDYVSESIITEIKAAISNTESYKLKDIKEKISKDISYFQIRLVLARTE